MSTVRLVDIQEEGRNFEIGTANKYLGMRDFETGITSKYLRGRDELKNLFDDTKHHEIVFFKSLIYFVDIFITLHNS